MKKDKITATATEEQAEQQEILIEDNTKHNFIIVYDTFYKNKELTAEEIALFIKLKAAAPTFKITQDKLAQALNTCRDIIKKASKGLQKKGYLKIEHPRSKSACKWIINDAPIFKNIDYNNLDIRKLSFETMTALLQNKKTPPHIKHKIFKEIEALAKYNVYKD